MALFDAPECHVFRVPPTDFLKSETWEGNLIWSGSIRVFQNRIELYDASGIFGVCPLNVNDDGPTPVQPATDSRRCFVVRIEQASQFAYLGINFESREVAFQFSSAILDRYRTASDRQVPTAEVHDRRLKPGETFAVDLEGKLKVATPAGVSGSKAAGGSNATGGTSSGDFVFSAGLQTRTGPSRRVSSNAPAQESVVPASVSRDVAPPRPKEPEFDPFGPSSPAAATTTTVSSHTTTRPPPGDFDPFSSAPPAPTGPSLAGTKTEAANGVDAFFF